MTTYSAMSIRDERANTGNPLLNAWLGFVDFLRYIAEEFRNPDKGIIVRETETSMTLTQELAKVEVSATLKPVRAGSYASRIRKAGKK